MSSIRTLEQNRIQPILWFNYVGGSQSPRGEKGC
jgi:hypothetical protein